MRTRNKVVLAVVAWFACGFVAAGFSFAHFQRAHPTVAKDLYSFNKRSFWKEIVMGPPLLGIVAFTGHMNHGFLVPGKKAKREAKKLQSQTEKADQK